MGRWLARIAAGGLGLLGLLFAASLFTRTVSSPRFCSSCHTMRAAASSASLSVHAAVPCLACHRRPGLRGAITYLPTLAREALAEAARPSLARGALRAVPCERCHTRVVAAPILKEGHPPPSSDCRSCHGEVAHPRPSPEPQKGHPPGYSQTHGREAAPDPGSCSTCHKPEFCQACHFRAGFPHPEGWIGQHGKVEETKGPQACSLCHPPSFCKGCHGTEIPHSETWLRAHRLAVRETGDSPCYTCHPRSDCGTCHARHEVHREQDLYTGM